MVYTRAKIDPAYIEAEISESENFPHSYIRKFQKEALDWYEKNDTEPLLLLQSPTGSGKTEVFSEIAKRNKKTVIVYPTNSLLKQQKKIMSEKEGLRPEIVDSEHINESGVKRRENLKAVVEHPRNNIILTNPDILQSILQGNYIDPENRLIRSLFEYIDTVIYDEFHFYGEFESSGLLLQTKIFSQRMKRSDKSPKIIISSATPTKKYIEYLESELNLPICRVNSYVTNTHRPNNLKKTQTQKFREKTNIQFYKEDILSKADSILSEISNILTHKNDLKEPSIGIICNSAKDSNVIQSIAEKKYPKVARNMKKDNGYDTHDNSENNESYYILNTTSKGEVGLDFDITHLYMDKTHTANSFIQRFGRAGRKSKARISVYNFEPPQLPQKQKYTEFVKYIHQNINSELASQNRTKELIGMRSAAAVYSREKSSININNELYSDFKQFDAYSRWKQFFENAKFEDSVWVTPSPSAEQIVNYIQDCIDKILSNLRGFTASSKIQYQIGNISHQTEYDIVTALEHYTIDKIDSNNKLYLSHKRDETNNIEIRIKHFSDLIEDFYTFKWNGFDIKTIETKLYQSNIENVTSLNIPSILNFFRIIGKEGKIPQEIHTPKHTISL